MEVQEGPEAGSLSPSMIFNLSKAVVMIVDDNAFSLRLTAQTLLGFGVRSRHQCADADQAQELLRSAPVDLLIVDCEMPGRDGYDLVSWLRHSGGENAWIPVIMLSGHTRQSKVLKARDCGANFIVTRPISPSVLLERIVWVAKDPRPMLQAGDYAGPDRRFQEGEPTKETGERRADLIRAAQAAALQARADEEAGDPPAAGVTS